MSLTDDERHELIESITMMLTSTIGPTGDLHRAVIAAKVDGLIDARKRFLAAGWPEWLIQSVLVAFITNRAMPVKEPDE
jgi:hypothetical protein